MIARRRILPSVALLVTLAGCGMKEETYPPAAQSGLTLLNSSVKKDAGGKRTIVGAVRNDSNGTYQYVQVEFNLFDRGGHGVGSTLVKTSGLGPGRTWEFAAPVGKKQAYRYTVDDVTGY